MIVSRYYNTTALQLTVEFLTPTFLGGADQQAELRAAPFKNLFRQWWRVACGPQYLNCNDLLRAEGDLFGSALDEKKSSASKIRLFLAPFEEAFFIDNKTPDFGRTYHPEVTPRKTNHPEEKKGMWVSNALYLGYGPISWNNNEAVARKYITPGSKAGLEIRFPKLHAATVLKILEFIDAFGTVGSRSRNGWGSISLSGDGFRKKELHSFPRDHISRLIGDNPEYAKNYPLSLGCDDSGLLCWETAPVKKDWKEAMQLLAETYLNLRTSLTIKPQGLRERHILGYPVTNHFVKRWEGSHRTTSGRMPSQLRLMVKRDQKEQLAGRILHLPHNLPKSWDNSLGPEIDIWKKIHTILDENSAFHRSGGAK